MLPVERESVATDGFPPINRKIYSTTSGIASMEPFVLPPSTTLGSRPGIRMVAGYPCRDIAWDFTEIITKPHYPGAHLISF